MDMQSVQGGALPVGSAQPGGSQGPAAPMAALMERLEQAAPFVSVKDPTLKDRIGWLADEAAAAPAALDKTWFKTRVSYVVQDVERLNGTQLVMDTALRAELDKLAFSSPGLRHEQLAALVRDTANLRPEDGPLAQDIRRLARSAVTGGVDGRASSTLVPKPQERSLTHASGSPNHLPNALYACVCRWPPMPSGVALKRAHQPLLLGIQTVRLRGSSTGEKAGDVAAFRSAAEQPLAALP